MLTRISRLTLPTIIVIVALAIYRFAFVPEEPANITAGRNEPVSIQPENDRPRMVSDDELFQILDRVKPHGQPVNTNNWVHALRLWGRHAEFDSPRTPSGHDLWSYFVDDEVFRRHAGEGTPALFNIAADGVRIRGFDDDYGNSTTSSYHMDDLLATMAETGTPLDTPLRTRDGETTVRAAVESAMQDFHLSRHEFEWSMITYARYAFPRLHWVNRYGRTIDVDQMVNEMIRHPLPNGPCNGTHRLEAMVVLYRADRETPTLDPRTRKRMLVHMAQVSRLLVQAQSEDGYWNRNWPRGNAAKDVAEVSLSDKLLVTGHHLEWLALAPEEVQPPRETLVRASRWLVGALLEIDDKELDRRYGPLSHAARSLCLWRGKEPYQAWRDGRDAQAEKQDR